MHENDCPINGISCVSISRVEALGRTKTAKFRGARKDL